MTILNNLFEKIKYSEKFLYFCRRKDKNHPTDTQLPKQ